ncbi:hypothetical protein C8J56DRAFT_956774 [Mycena floridula]|nr:hypothetical protein C8J56DRAFT_956774 [Mycena floridula]
MYFDNADYPDSGLNATSLSSLCSGFRVVNLGSDTGIGTDSWNNICTQNKIIADLTPPQYRCIRLVTDADVEMWKELTFRKPAILREIFVKFDTTGMAIDPSYPPIKGLFEFPVSGLHWNTPHDSRSVITYNPTLEKYLRQFANITKISLSATFLDSFELVKFLGTIARTLQYLTLNNVKFEKERIYNTATNPAPILCCLHCLVEAYFEDCNLGAWLPLVVQQSKFPQLRELFFKENLTSQAGLDAFSSLVNCAAKSLDLQEIGICIDQPVSINTFFFSTTTTFKGLRFLRLEVMLGVPSPLPAELLPLLHYTPNLEEITWTADVPGATELDDALDNRHFSPLLSAGPEAILSSLQEVMLRIDMASLFSGCEPLRWISTMERLKFGQGDTAFGTYACIEWGVWAEPAPVNFREYWKNPRDYPRDDLFPDEDLKPNAS